MTSFRRGVYFLSDDRIMDLTIAFLNSFRLHNPDVSLCLIPCNDEVDRIRALRSEYDFAVYEDADVLGRCDEISLCFHDHVLGQYRKLAMWEAGFDEFLYIDVDTVILDSVDFVFKYLADYDFVTSHSNMRSLRKHVWKHTIRKSGLLTREQISYSTNTGFIASRKSALPLDRACELSGRVDSLKSHMVLHCVEQPYLNYLIVTSGKRFTSLRVLEKQGGDPEMRTERWAGEPLGITRNGNIRFLDRRPPVLLLHWAGKWQPTALDRRLQRMVRFLGMKIEAGRSSMRYFMPYKKLWNHYRFLRDRGES